MSLLSIRGLPAAHSGVCFPVEQRRVISCPVKGDSTPALSLPESISQHSDGCHWCLKVLRLCLDVDDPPWHLFSWDFVVTMSALCEHTQCGRSNISNQAWEGKQLFDCNLEGRFDTKSFRLARVHIKGLVSTQGWLQAKPQGYFDGSWCKTDA